MRILSQTALRISARSWGTELHCRILPIRDQRLPSVIIASEKVLSDDFCVVREMRHYVGEALVEAEEFDAHVQVNKKYKMSILMGNDGRVGRIDYDTRASGVESQSSRPWSCQAVGKTRVRYDGSGHKVRGTKSQAGTNYQGQRVDFVREVKVFPRFDHLGVCIDTCRVAFLVDFIEVEVCCRRRRCGSRDVRIHHRIQRLAPNGRPPIYQSILVHGPLCADKVGLDVDLDAIGHGECVGSVAGGVC